MVAQPVQTPSGDAPSPTSVPPRASSPVHRAGGGKISSLISSLQQTLGDKPAVPASKPPIHHLKKKPPVPPMNKSNAATPVASPRSRSGSTKQELEEMESRLMKIIETERKAREELENEVARLRQMVEQLTQKSR